MTNGTKKKIRKSGKSLIFGFMHKACVPHHGFVHREHKNVWKKLTIYISVHQNWLYTHTHTLTVSAWTCFLWSTLFVHSNYHVVSSPSPFYYFVVAKQEAKYSQQDRYFFLKKNWLYILGELGIYIIF